MARSIDPVVHAVRGFVPARTDEERFLMRHIEDLARTAQSRGIARYSGFLSDREQEVVEQLRYVEDAAVEVDVEAELPDSYVSQTAEKLRLYRELDAMRSEEELQRFEQRLVDRFGALPQAARELLDVVRLRWEAVRLGMERVKVKNGLMIVHFVGDAASPFYKSEVFSELLRRVTRRPDKFVLKQHNNRLAMTVRGVTDIAGAWEILKSLYKEQDA